MAKYGRDILLAYIRASAVRTHVRSFYVTVAIDTSKATNILYGFPYVTHATGLLIVTSVRQIIFFHKHFLLAYIKITMKRPIVNVLCKGVDIALKLAKVH